MQSSNRFSAFILGAGIFLGLSVLGYFLATAAIDIKQYERSVLVKGLSEREYPADIIIWPIEFTLAENDMEILYKRIDDYTQRIRSFLINHKINADDISMSSPSITDKTAQQYSGNPAPRYRYSASQVITVYSSNIDAARQVMSKLSELGKQGIVFNADPYQYQTEYIFTRLNEVKPEMIEEATRKARQVAEKFASDSQSSLGKIKRASQGQFSISPRDNNNPHIKRVRVVSTVQYYLSD